jgi:hypothetical protein
METDQEGDGSGRRGNLKERKPKKGLELISRPIVSNKNNQYKMA